MRKNILYLFLIIASNILAQTNYQDLLARGQRTYWATPISICHPACNLRQVGMYFDPNGLFDWYKIDDDNDTLSLYYNEENLVSHRTYNLKNDTIYITTWSSEGDYGKIFNAYKILYLTDKRLVVLELEPNDVGNWVESVTHYNDSCDELRVLDYKCVKP